jgi:hypothetical protein
MRWALAWFAQFHKSADLRRSSVERSVAYVALIRKFFTPSRIHMARCAHWVRGLDDPIGRNP